MKKGIILLTYLMLSVTAFGQSTLIQPGKNQLEHAQGDNIEIISGSEFSGVQGLRFNGPVTAKMPVLSGNRLITISAGGFNSPSSFTVDQAMIQLSATQNWTSTAYGTKIGFFTTSNNQTTAFERMVINQNGNIGIGNLSPTGKLHINHFASGTSPTIHLQSTGSNSSIIKATSTLAGEWENHFLNGATGATNLVYWVNSVNASTPLILTGEGDALVERNTAIGGFTTLGTGAPKIKMKELSTTTSASSGGTVPIAHGLTQSKILSVSVLVNASSGSDIPPSYNSSTFTGFLYYYYVTGTNVVIENSSGNHTAIAGRPVKILITYKE